MGNQQKQLRVMMEEFLKDLWAEWQRCAALAETKESCRMNNTNATAAMRSPRPARSEVKPISGVPGAPITENAVVIALVKPIM